MKHNLKQIHMNILFYLIELIVLDDIVILLVISLVKIWR